MVNKPVYFCPKRVLAGLLFLVCLTAITFFSRHLQTSPSLSQERLLFIPPTQYLQGVRGGFRNFLADIYYIRGILGITDRFKNRQEKIRWLQEIFKATVLLDSQMLQAYFFGGSAIVNSKEELRQGIQFLNLGLYLSPQYWQIPYWIGFNYYLLGDYLRAVKFYQQASKFPEAPGYLKSNQPMLYYKAGQPKLGLMYLEGLLESVNDPQQLKWIKLKIDWLKNIVILEEAVEKFKERFSQAPQDLKELINRGFIQEIPEDPFGGGYYWDKESQRVKSRMGGLGKSSNQKTGGSKSCPQ